MAFQLLPDRMHVISKGSDGRVCKWSVLQGVKVQTFPENTDYESVVRQVTAMLGSARTARSYKQHALIRTPCYPLFRVHQVEALVKEGNSRPKWCDVDAQTGSLAVHITESMVR